MSSLLNGANTLITSQQQQLPPNKRMGFCESEQKWYKFDSETDSSNCPDCGNKASNKIGFQITTQRSFDPAAKKLSKAAQKKMGMGA